MGKAVLVYAKAAARARLQPCSSFTDIISTAMIASSTSSPSASTSVPSDTLCSPMPNMSMNSAVIASTTGIEITTTMPVRKPSDTRLTISTMATASATERRKSSTECDTACGMLETSVSVSPAGSCVFNSPNLASSDLPRRTTSWPGCMVMPMPSTGPPERRICWEGGSS
ncbi:hypothetical protein D3C85_455470 [compost metagenome]